MANMVVALMRRVKTDAGWRYYPAAYHKNGRVKPAMAIVDGLEVMHEIGHYELRYNEGAKLVFKTLGDAPAADAENARRQKERELEAITKASRAGIKLAPVDPGRKLISEELRHFLKDTNDNGAHEAADVYRLACDEFLAVIGRRYVDEVVHSDVRKFQVALQNRGMSPRTVKNRHASVKAFLKYLRYDFQSDDAAGKPFPKTPRFDEELPEIYTDWQLNDLFSKVTSAKENLLYQVLLETGLRERDAMPLEWTDINHETKKLKVQPKPRWKSRIKTYEQREQSLSDGLLARPSAYHRDHAGESSLIFGKEGKLDGHMLRTLKRRVRAAGLNCGKCEGCLMENPKRSRECEEWGLHKFRATYGTKLLRDGLDIRTVQKMMGHKELASTMRYVRPAENIDIQRRLSSLKWF
jgi:site-specific recombinase XerD